MSNTRVQHWAETGMYLDDGDLTISDTPAIADFVGSGKLVDPVNEIEEITAFDPFPETPTINTWTPANRETPNYFIGTTGLGEWSVTVKFDNSNALHNKFYNMEKRTPVHFCAYNSEGTGKVSYYTMLFSGASEEYLVDDVNEVTFMFQITSRKLKVEGS